MWLIGGRSYSFANNICQVRTTVYKGFGIATEDNSTGIGTNPKHKEVQWAFGKLNLVDPQFRRQGYDEFLSYPVCKSCNKLNIRIDAFVLFETEKRRRKTYYVGEDVRELLSRTGLLRWSSSARSWQMIQHL
jgi:hypothetical protein